MKVELISNVHNMLKYIDQEIAKTLENYKIPTFLAKFIGNAGVALIKGLLDLNYYIARPYIPKRFIEEMKVKKNIFICSSIY